MKLVLLVLMVVVMVVVWAGEPTPDVSSGTSASRNNEPCTEEASASRNNEPCTEEASASRNNEPCTEEASASSNNEPCTEEASESNPVDSTQAESRARALRQFTTQERVPVRHGCPFCAVVVVELAGDDGGDEGGVRPNELMDHHLRTS
jgi:hypothetical protein